MPQPANKNPDATWGKRPRNAASVAPPDALDSFVTPGKAAAIKRLNLNVPASLHARIKARCATEGHDMTEVLITHLEKLFPAS